MLVHVYFSWPVYNKKTMTDESCVLMAPGADVSRLFVKIWNPSAFVLAHESGFNWCTGKGGKDFRMELNSLVLPKGSK